MIDFARHRPEAVKLTAEQVAKMSDQEVLDHLKDIGAVPAEMELPDPKYQTIPLGDLTSFMERSPSDDGWQTLPGVKIEAVGLFNPRSIQGAQTRRAASSRDMSNSFATAIYGCPIPSPYGLSDEDMALALQLSEDAGEMGVAESEIGWHRTYTGHQNYFWFGVASNTVQNGFGKTRPVSHGDILKVDLAFATLPEATRALLGDPEHLLMVGTD